MEPQREEDEYVIALEVTSAVNELVSNDMTTIIRDTLDDVLCRTFIMHKVTPDLSYTTLVEQVMLDLLCKYVIGES